MNSLTSALYHFHHFGLATKNIKTSRNSLLALGYTISFEIHDPLQSVWVQLATKKSSPTIELVWQDDSSMPPLSNFFKHHPYHFYHSCYTCSDFLLVEHYFKKGGHRLKPLTEAKPAILFSNKLVKFYYLDGIGIIEFLLND
jgi:hypothetical protein